MFNKLLLFVMFQSSKAAIYRLNDSDYGLMPPIFHMDPYEACYDDPDALYCTVELTLVSDEPSPLLTMIQEYSSPITHYNHTRLRYGICVTRTCRKFYEAEQDLRLTLEACANESLYNKYNLKAKLSDGFDCSKREKSRDIDFVDLTVAGICVTILCANVVGSICDYWFSKGKDDGSVQLVYCFSIFRNWENLVSSPVEDCDPRLQALKGLHGIRVLNICFVIIAHACLVTFMSTENPEYIEDIFMTRPYHIILNATVIMQTFLLISSFLLVYNSLINSEKHEISWRTLPKQFIKRWLRLTPPYAVILALTATWFGRLTSGPFWKKIVFNEVSDCRRDWWKHLLYINNYFDNSECMGQTWYLGADMQLYWLAAIVFVMCQTPRARKRALSLLFLAGLIIPTLHTYFQDLDGVLIISPELILTMFMGNRTFNEVYKRGHTNLCGYVIGMAMAYLIYDWQKTSGDPRSLQKFRWLVWLSFPLACLCCYSGSMFYTDTPPPPTYVHLLFAAFIKPVFGILIGTIVVGVIMKIEGVYRGVLEWSGWVTASRLSFSAYLLHCFFVRNYMVMQVTTARTTILNVVLQSAAILMASFLSAIFFWILVEAPLSNLVQEYLGKFKAKGTQRMDVESTKKMVAQADLKRREKELLVDKSVNKIVAKMQ